MSDRFQEMAGRVQLDVESYALRHSIDGRRRVIAEALKAAYERGQEEAEQRALTAPSAAPERTPSSADGELRALCERAIKYAREDRMRTPGSTRLARVLDEMGRALARLDAPKTGEKL